MTTINRKALVPYSQRQMFELVNSVEDYPRFLPWCHSSEITNKTDQEIVASLEIAWKGIHKSFSTRNQLVPYECIKISLVKGPMRHLEGIWKFKALEDKGCKITLDLKFEFSASFIDMLFEPVFNHIANALVDAFCKRASEVYGDE